jgi:predicted transcriptional regulator
VIHVALKKLTPEQLSEAIDLQRRCMTHEAIAEKLGVHRHTVRRHLEKHNNALLKRLESTRLAEKTRQLKRLEWVVEQAAHGWQRSLEDAETIKTTDDASGADKTERTVKGQSGNPAMLAQLRETLADIRDLLKLDQIGGEPEDENDDDIDPNDPRYVGRRGLKTDGGVPGGDAPP